MEGENSTGQPVLPKKSLFRRMPKWAVGTLIAVVVLGLAGVVGWRLGWYTKMWNQYNQASMVIKVKQDNTFAIAGAKVVLGSQAYASDSNGRIAIDHITAGTYTLKVTKDGYDTVNRTLALHRGENDLQVISLKKLPAKLYAIKGFVQDYVSNQPVVNVQVSLGDRKVLTDPSGAYHFDNNAPGDFTLTLSKSGYQDKQVPVKVVSADVVTAQVPLISAGVVVFTSNRDGKRLLYASDYTGTNQHLFLKDDAGEDFNPIMSPDGKWIVFSSTRNHMKDGYGQDMSTLYSVGSDGNNLKVISTDVSYNFNASWSPNSQYVYFSGFAGSSTTTPTYHIYGVLKGVGLDVGEAANDLVFSADGNMVAYYTSATVDNPATATDSSQSAKIVQNVLKTWNLVTGERKSLASKTQYLTDIRFGADSSSVSYEVTIDSVRHRYQDVISSGVETEVTPDAVAKLQYVPSPDGKYQAVVDQRDGKYDVFITDSSLGNPQRLTNLGVVDQMMPPQWTPDGEDIIFTVKREAETALYIVAAAGGDPKKVADYDLEQ